MTVDAANPLVGLGAGSVKGRYSTDVEMLPAWQLKRIADALERLVEQNEERKNLSGGAAEHDDPSAADHAPGQAEGAASV